MVFDENNYCSISVLFTVILTCELNQLKTDNKLLQIKIKELEDELLKNKIHII